MIADLSRAARLVVLLIPVDDREWVVGDLLEDADNRGRRGPWRECWLAAECAVIAAGLAFERARDAYRMPPLREVAVGLGIHGHSGSKVVVLVDALLVSGAIAALAFGVEILIRTLFVAAGL